MNLTESLRMLMRRWYILFPGIILTMVLAFVAFMFVRPTYERAASVLLLPDSASIPKGGNPYLFMSGLSGVADVVVRSANAQEFHDGITEEFPGAEITIGRDMTTASPVISIIVSSADDGAAGTMLDGSIDHVVAVLGDLQEEEGIPPAKRISSVVLVADATGTVVQKTRLLVTAVVVAGGVLLSVLLAAVVEGLSTQRRRRGQPAAVVDPGPDADEAVENVPLDEASAPVASTAATEAPAGPDAPNGPDAFDELDLADASVASARRGGRRRSPANAGAATRGAPRR